MKNRKGYALAFSAILVTGFGLSLAKDDEKTKVGKAMDIVQVKNAYIIKNIRSEALLKKNQKAIGEAATELAKAGKSVRDDKGPSEKEKKPQKDWEKFMDDYVKASEDFATEVVKADMTPVKAKAEFKKVQDTCTACHKVFRPED